VSATLAGMQEPPAEQGHAPPIDDVEEASRGSFPASDAPGWWAGRDEAESDHSGDEAKLKS
jgi:hypothetical protein